MFPITLCCQETPCDGWGEARVGGEDENSTISAPVSPAETWHVVGRFVRSRIRHETVLRASSGLHLSATSPSLSLSLRTRLGYLAYVPIKPDGHISQPPECRWPISSRGASIPSRGTGPAMIWKITKATLWCPGEICHRLLCNLLTRQQSPSDTQKLCHCFNSVMWLDTGPLWPDFRTREHILLTYTIKLENYPCFGHTNDCPCSLDMRPGYLQSLSITEL